MGCRAGTARPRRAAAGCLLALAVAAAVASGFAARVPVVPAGLCVWIAGLLLWRDTAAVVRRQAVALAAIGVGGFLIALAQGASPAADQALYANVPLVGMLAGVSFLRLVATPAATAADAAPSGKRSVAATLLGLHLTGAVANLSALVLVSRPMATDERLDSRQVRVLTRGFATAALWSPFFASMAAALTFAPGARLAALVTAGLPLALAGLLLTYREVARESPHTFRGYPMRPATLWLPAALALTIMAVHGLAPELPVLGLITLLAPAMAAATLVLRRGPALAPLRGHVLRGLPLMRNELILFLAAGVLAGGINAAIPDGGGWLPWERFAAPQASAVLVAMVGLAVIGVHPLISIAVFGTAVAPLNPDPDLLAMTFLAAWSVGVTASPLSAINLTLQGMYGFAGRRILRWNGGYSLIMLVLAAIALNVYGALGIL